MKYILIISIASLLITGCAVNQMNSPISNSIAIRNSIQSMQLPSAISKDLNPSDKIAFISIEKSKTLDDAITAQIEDVVISNFIEKGYSIYERDADMLKNIYSETEDNYKMSNNLISPKVTENQEWTIATRMKSVDKLISYRVEEIGIIYTNKNDKKETTELLPKEIFRQAKVILNVRVENAKTGQIMSCQKLQGDYTDKINEENKVAYSNFHYTNFTPAYPVINGNGISVMTINEQQKKGKGTMIAWIVLILGGGLLGLIAASM